MRASNEITVTYPEDEAFTGIDALSPPDRSPLQQARAAVLGNKPCGCSYSRSNKAIADEMMCVRPAGEAACQVTPLTVIYIIKTLFYSVSRRHKVSVSVDAPFKGLLWRTFAVHAAFSLDPGRRCHFRTTL